MTEVWAMPIAAASSRSPISLHIPLAGAPPAKVLAHRCVHHPLPGVPFRVAFDRLPSRAPERRRRILVEQKAGRSVLDRIGQPTDATSHRNGAVELRAHLCQAAGLIQ